MTGWECPKCGRCYAPFVSECRNCNGTITNESTIDFGNTIFGPSPLVCFHDFVQETSCNRCRRCGKTEPVAP